MPKVLSSAQVEQYKRDGFTAPVAVLTAEEVKKFRGEMEAYEEETGKPIGYPEKSKPYLLFGWADAMVHHPRVLDAVEDIIGPDILVYHTALWTKEARSESFAAWHQDDVYFNLDPQEHVTAWVALSEASEAAGCMRMVPGSHLTHLEHEETPSSGNIIRRGLSIRNKFSENDGVAVPLHAGEMSLHNTLMAHSSGPNHSDDRRIGLGISYIPAHVRSRTELRSSTLLVRGEDRYQNFYREERLQVPLSADARAAHSRGYKLYIASARIPEGA